VTPTGQAQPWSRFCRKTVTACHRPQPGVPGCQNGPAGSHPPRVERDRLRQLRGPGPARGMHKRPLAPRPSQPRPRLTCPCTSLAFLPKIPPPPVCGNRVPGPSPSASLSAPCPCPAAQLFQHTVPASHWHRLYSTTSSPLVWELLPGTRCRASDPQPAAHADQAERQPESDYRAGPGMCSRN
jgi:hypothetical protein